MSVDNENAPAESLSLRSFCSKAKSFYNGGSPKDIADFVRFTLTGEVNGTQYFVDPVLNELTPQHPTRGMRDFDSLLGIEPNIVVQDALTVYPVCRFDDTLVKSVHLEYDITRDELTHKVPLHHVPNIGLGKWGTHNLVRVLLPALWNPIRRSILTQAEKITFYEKGLRPAAIELMGDWSDDWPPTYTAEMIRAQSQNGKFSFQTKILPSWNVEALGEAIRRHLSANDIAWGEGLVFLHQLKGVKGSSRHQDSQPHVAKALEEFFIDNRLLHDTLNPESWWIDIGFEISSARGHCLQWRTDHHRHAIASMFSITDELAGDITRQGSSKYTRDMVAHLPSVSGCRISPGTRTHGPYSVQYAQLYTTEKSLTYKSTGPNASLHMECPVVFKEGAGTKLTDGLQRIYLDATDAQTPSHARMEVRVPLTHASSALVNVDIPQLKECLLAFNPTSWWNFRLYRLMACRYVIDWYSEGTPRTCSQDEALLLICAVVWIINSLNSTPDLRSASRSLLTAALPHVQRNGADPDVLVFHTRTTSSLSEDDEYHDPEDMSLVRPTIPYIPHGVIFLRRILVGEMYPVPRLQESAYRLSAKAFEFFFKVPKAHIRTKYLQPGITTTITGRVSNKARKTMHWVDLEDTPSAPIFDLESIGFSIPPPDMDPEFETGNDEPMRVDDMSSIDQALSSLWQTFILDLLRKSPNPKLASKASYLKLSAAERELGTEAIFKCRQLSTYWTDCQWKISTTESWSMTFDYLWPIKGHVLQPKAQHYPQCCYYSDWCALTARTDDLNVDAMRQSLRLRFDSLYWVPSALSDRIWLTKWERNFQKSSGIDAKKPAPRILINPAFKNEHPIW